MADSIASHMSMRSKAFLIVMFAVLLPLSVGMFFSYRSFRSALRSELMNTSRLLAAQFADKVCGDVVLEDQRAIDRSLEMICGNHDIVFAAVYDTDGTPLGICSEVEVLVGQHRASTASARMARTHRNQEVVEVRTPVRSDDGTQVGTMRVLFSVHRVDIQLVAMLRRIVTASCVLLLLVSAIGAYLADYYLTRPIMKLVDLVGNIANGHYKQRITLESGSEIGRLAQSVNTMSDQINRNFEEINSAKERFQTTLNSIGDAVIAADINAAVSGKLFICKMLASA